MMFDQYSIETLNRKLKGICSKYDKLFTAWRLYCEHLANVDDAIKLYPAIDQETKQEVPERREVRFLGKTVLVQFSYDFATGLGEISYSIGEASAAVAFTVDALGNLDGHYGVNRIEDCVGLHLSKLLDLHEQLTAESSGS